MNIFVTGITGPDPDRTTTCEHVRTNWAKGLKGTHSEQTRAKMSAALKGKTHSAETRAKMSAALKGRTYSAETRAKKSAAQKGKTHSAESRAAIGAARKGKTHSAESRAAISAANGKPVMTPNGIFPSMREVIRVSGYTRNQVERWFKQWPEHYYRIKKEAK